MFTALSFGLCAFVFVHLGQPLLAVGKVEDGICDVYLTMGDGVSVPRFVRRRRNSSRLGGMMNTSASASRIFWFPSARIAPAPCVFTPTLSGSSAVTG